MASQQAHDSEIAEHLQLVEYGDETESTKYDFATNELTTAPLFSSQIKALSPSPAVFPQYGLMGIRLETYGEAQASEVRQVNENSLVYANTNAPWSTFICGSQGSGKSHTLSCMLENSLVVPSKTGKNKAPLSALVLHYDKFTGLQTGQLCEAAYICSVGIPVRVLVSPSSFSRMKQLYENLPGLSPNSKRPKVTPLKFSNKHLSIGMMKSLMAVGGGDPPLYMAVSLTIPFINVSNCQLSTRTQVVSKVLQDMAEQEETFDYVKFKTRLCSQDWVKGQTTPLEMRLQMLESFLDVDKTTIPELGNNPEKQVKPQAKKALAPPSLSQKQKKKKAKTGNTKWEFDQGSLTIVDLSCPFVDESESCALFNICLSIFLASRNSSSRIIALDEAHKVSSTVCHCLIVYSH